MNTGFIVAFSGSFDNGYPVDKETGLVDKSWHVCDGTNGTPDLRGRFVLGASDTYKVGSTGGEAAHSLNINELPTFTPSIKVSLDEKHLRSNSMWHGTRDCVAGGYDSPKYSSTPFKSVGGNKSHNNMPPYYALSYIMKIR